MAEFIIKIAGHAAKISSSFGSTRDYCRAYLTEEEPEYYITVTKGDLEFEQRFLDQEALEEGLRRRVFSDPFLERAAIQRKLSEQLLEQGILLVHGSTVSVDAQGYLFTAKCGTGKSTHTRLWRQTFGDLAVMVNDDKPFVAVTGQEILVSGSPWSGKHGLDTNITVPLKGICILTRGKENRIRRISGEEARDMIFHQASPPLDEKKRPQFEWLVENLLDRVAFWEMECNQEPEAALTAYRAMSQRK